MLWSNHPQQLDHDFHSMRYEAHSVFCLTKFNKSIHEDFKILNLDIGDFEGVKFIYQGFPYGILNQSQIHLDLQDNRQWENH